MVLITKARRHREGPFLFSSLGLSVSVVQSPFAKTRLLHASSLVSGSRLRRRYHQAQTLQQHHRPLRRSTPNELAALALAVLYVDIAARILQAAILERTVDEDTVIKNQVLIFEDFVFVSGHQKLSLSLAGRGRKLRVGLVVSQPEFVAASLPRHVAA
jgi:hypothetical protein